MYMDRSLGSVRPRIWICTCTDIYIILLLLQKSAVFINRMVCNNFYKLVSSRNQCCRLIYLWLLHNLLCISHVLPGYRMPYSFCIMIFQDDIESMTRYMSPVNPAVFPHLTVVLLGIGIFFTAWFFVYEVTSTKFTRDIFKELLVALVAAIFSGFGFVFLLLWVGIYVWYLSVQDIETFVKEMICYTSYRFIFFRKLKMWAASEI